MTLVSVDSKTKERIKLTPVDFGDGSTENIAELEESLEGVTTTIQTLIDRERSLAAEENPVKAVADQCRILREPPKPWTCTTNSAPDGRNQCRGQGCTYQAIPGDIFCLKHRIRHHNPSILRSRWRDMERARVKVADIEVGRSQDAVALHTGVVNVNEYCWEVYNVLKAMKEHQDMYSCKSK